MRIIARCDFLPMSHQVKVFGNGEFQFSFMGGSLGQCLFKNSHKVGVGDATCILSVKVEECCDIMVLNGGIYLRKYKSSARLILADGFCSSCTIIISFKECRR